MNACSYCGYFGFNLVSQESIMCHQSYKIFISLFLSCLLLCASVFVIVTKEEIFAVAALIIIFSHISWKRSKCTGPELCLMTHCWRREQLVQQSQMNSSVFFVHIIWQSKLHLAVMSHADSAWFSEFLLAYRRQKIACGHIADLCQVNDSKQTLNSLRVTQQSLLAPFSW